MVEHAGRRAREKRRLAHRLLVRLAAAEVAAQTLRHPAGHHRERSLPRDPRDGEGPAVLMCQVPPAWRARNARAGRIIPGIADWSLTRTVRKKSSAGRGWCRPSALPVRTSTPVSG